MSVHPNVLVISVRENVLSIGDVLKEAEDLVFQVEFGDVIQGFLGN